MKKIVLGFLIFILFIGTASAISIYIKNSDFIFNTAGNSNITVLGVSTDIIKIKQEYKSTNTYTDMGTGILESELFGDFYIKNDIIDLIKDNSINSNCTSQSYTFSGAFISPSFGTLEINNDNDNYYCPTTGSASLSFSSDLLGNIVISDAINVIYDYNIVNSRGEDITVSSSYIFDDNNISINGLTNIENNEGIDSDIVKDSFIQLTGKVTGEMANFNQVINKNLAKYTKGLTPETNNLLSSFSSTKKIFYYDFQGDEDTDSSNKDNKGKILTLEQGGAIMGVYNQQLLYVKGGNLYIKEDIKNDTNKSQLVIVVKRDSTNRKNGGNVYIDPGVTNIDAIIIAEGSIISYNGTNILNAEDNSSDLRKQLLIYGSISTKNTFGEDKAVYGTDDYIINGGKEVTNINTYNLAKLRSFQAILNDSVSGNCSANSDGDPQIVAKGDDSTIAIKYAFAGKKECYLTDDTRYDLRSTDKLTPLVIEYNPAIQNNPHFILQK